MTEQVESDSEDYWYYKYCEDEWALFDSFESVSMNMRDYLAVNQSRNHNRIKVRIMRIIMIRHEKVDMLWDKKYNSATFDLACDKYDECPIALPSKEYSKIDDAKTVYISELSRTYETACRLFNKSDFIKTSLLNEVPLKSFKDTNKMYPLWLWNFTGRFQWFLQSDRQAESKKQTVIRAKKMIALLEKHQEDCYLITHGFYMKVLIRELKKQGYKIKNDSIFVISYLDMIVAIK